MRRHSSPVFLLMAYLKKRLIFFRSSYVNCSMLKKKECQKDLSSDTSLLAYQMINYLVIVGLKKLNQVYPVNSSPLNMAPYITLSSSNMISVKSSFQVPIMPPLRVR